MGLETDYKTVRSVREIHQYIGDSKVLAFDFETAPDDEYRDEERAALDPARSHIVTLSISVRETTGIMIPVAHRTGANADREEFEAFLKEILMRKDIIKIAHNLSFEAMFAYAQGIVIQEPVYDTIAASQMVMKGAYGFRNLSESGLKTLADEMCGEPLPSFSTVTGGRHFDELDPDDPETIRYSCADADFALRLYNIFNDWFDRFLPKHRWIVEHVESPTAVYLGIMKYNGVPVDRKLMERRSAEAEAEMERVRQEIAFMIGDVEIGSNCSTNAFKKYLYQDLGLPVLRKTESDKEALDDTALIMLKEWCDESRPELSVLFAMVQEYRKWGKIKSTYIDGYLQYLNPVTGKLHPDFFSLSTDTGRFNCRNPNLQNCFDPETEILTKRGFIRFPEATEDDMVAQWEDGVITFVRPTEIIRRHFTGELVSVTNQHIDLLMTPDHRCLVKSRYNDRFYVVPAERYPQDAVQIHAGDYGFGSIHLSDEQVVLLAATQADGSWRDGGIGFSFVKARKYRRLTMALKKLDAGYGDTVWRRGDVSIHVYAGEITSWLMSLLGKEKQWGAWLLDFDRDTVERLLKELYHWDGCFTRENMYSTSIKSNSDWIQILYTLSGIRAKQRAYWNGNPKSVTNWQLDVVDRDYSMTRNAQKEHFPYDGEVYCVSVPSSYIVVRRNGKTAVTGNCPRKSNDPVGVRDFIKAPKGHLIVSCDYSQIELRVGAFYCRDEIMLDTYRHGGDIHAATTSVIFGIPYEQAVDKNAPDYKERRTIAKNVNFGTFYGLFPRGLQRTLRFKAGINKTEKECEEIISNLKAGYPRLATWQEETKAAARKRMYTETRLGRRRYLRDIRSKDWGKKSFAERCSMNTPIQGTAADIIKLSMGRITTGLPERPWLKPILQIHDELTFIVPAERLHEAVSFIRECMEQEPFPAFDLPLRAEASAGVTFGKMKELEE